MKTIILAIVMCVMMVMTVKAEDKSDSSAWGSSAVEFGKDSGKLLSKTGKDAALATKLWLLHTKTERKELAQSTGELTKETAKGLWSGVKTLGTAVVSGASAGATVVKEASDKEEFDKLLEDK